MKDSGIKWLGKIPNDWDVNKMHRICSLITDYVASGSFKSLADNVTYFDKPNYAMLIRTTDISGKKGSAQPIYVNEHSYNFLCNSNLFGGELILPNIGASIGDIYIVPKLYDKMTLAPNSILIKTYYNDKYYYYYFLTVGRHQVLDLSQSTAQGKFNKTELRALKVLTPPLEEQKKIASFLDNKCEFIDDINETLTREIKKLEEYRNSIITKLVYNKYGNIKLKYLVSKAITDGTHQTPEYSDEVNGSPFLSSKDITKGYIDWSDIKYITKDLHNQLQKEVKPIKGDILLAKNGTTGIAALVSDDNVFDIYVTLALIRCNRNKIMPKYLLYIINSSICKNQFNARLIGIGVPNLHLNMIENVKIPVPPLEEQKEIVEYLDKKCKQIDDMIDIKKQQIETLDKYKNSLIYEYVTGKKRVK